MAFGSASPILIVYFLIYLGFITTNNELFIMADIAIKSDYTFL